VSTDSSGPRLLVQRIQVSWTKESRGADGAVRRNAVPLAVPWRDSDAAFHSVAAAEESQFQPVEAWETAVPAEVIRDLDLRTEPQSVSILPALSGYWMPKRHRRPPRLRIAPNEWARWTINYRLGLDQGWVYGQVTYNVAFAAGEPGSAFAARCAAFVDERAALR